MQDSSSSRNDSTPILFALVCSICINLGQYAIANDAIRAKDLELYKATTATNICEGKFQGFIQGRR
jgi:hypothetical protein